MSDYTKPCPPGWFEYRILGLMPEVPQGHEFYSPVPDLDKHPELWDNECPYHIKDVRYCDMEKV